MKAAPENSTRPYGVDCRATYGREISRTPLLQAKQEKELAYRIQNGDAGARDHMVRANLALVVSLAKRYEWCSVPLDDLIAEGNLGLLRAAELYDPSRHTRFGTYAAYWIRQSLRRAWMNSGRIIRLPAYTFRLQKRWKFATSELQFELQRAPTIEEVADRLQLSKRQLRIVQQALNIFAFSECDWSIDGKRGLDDMVSDADPSLSIQQLQQRERVKEVLRLVEQLDRRKASIIRLRFGLDGSEPITLSEIGSIFHLTRERVRQLEKEALAELAQAV